MADLSCLQHRLGKLVELFITRFKRVRNKCHVPLSETKFVKLAQSRLDFELWKKFEGMEFKDLYKLSTMVTYYKLLLKKETQ